MRRKASILIGIWLMLCLLPVACLAEQGNRPSFQKVIYYVNGRSLFRYLQMYGPQSMDVKKEPANDSKTIGTAEPDDTYLYLGREELFQLCILYDSNTKGYVMALPNSKLEDVFVDIAQDTAGNGACHVTCSSDQEVSPTVQKFIDQLNQRPLVKYIRIRDLTPTASVLKEPGNFSEIIGTAAPDDTYLCLGEEKEGLWYCIQYDSDTKGYVSMLNSAVEYGFDINAKSKAGQENHQDQNGSESNNGPGRSSPSKKTCFVCGGTGRCKYCVAGRRYAGGDRMEMCPFCFGRMICHMCGGTGTTR